MPLVGPEFERTGYQIIPDLCAPLALNAIRGLVGNEKSSAEGAMRSKDLYAVRRALQVMPKLITPVMSDKLCDLVRSTLSKNAFLTKSIWFEKPPGGNWFVGWHQDISISVAERGDVAGYSRWTSKHGMIGVVPPVQVLERTLTVRIHLDDAGEDNGAVRVIPGSHRAGIQPPPLAGTVGELCSVPAGGVMLMRPLLIHASSRSVSIRPRRVLHLEFNDMDLDGGLEWAERMPLRDS